MWFKKLFFNNNGFYIISEGKRRYNYIRENKFQFEPIFVDKIRVKPFLMLKILI